MTMESLPPIVVSAAPLSALDVDWLVLPVCEDDRSAIDLAAEATDGELAQVLASGEFKPKPYELFVTPVTAAGWRPRRVALIGLGKAADADDERLRRAAATAVLAVRARNGRSLAFVCRPPDDGTRDLAALARRAQAVTEGLGFSAFDAGRYKTVDHEPWYAISLFVSVPGAGESMVAACRAAVDHAAVVAECTNWAREFSNEPGNRLRPEAFAVRAAELAARAGVAVEVLGERQLVELGMGLLLGVGRGSEEKPRLLVMRHAPATAVAAPVLGLVGKGVTFDAGGISIKPAQGMEKMKDDMAGGAAVVAAMCAIVRLQAPIPVVGVVPIAENMPSGHAIRPGDVLQSASGKTVEVIDTDAEGRLILADALWYARRLGATHVVDIATLTGACMVALGHTTSGLFGRPQPWVDTIRATAQYAGDRVWQMPLFEDYREQLRSDIADLKNVGGRPAGAITAAMFLDEFAGDGAWAHLDVAGTAWNEEAKPYLPKGPTGVGVRTLAALAFSELPPLTGQRG